jgi:hypothetical protein
LNIDKMKYDVLAFNVKQHAHQRGFLVV